MTNTKNQPTGGAEKPSERTKEAIRGINQSEFTPVQQMFKDQVSIDPVALQKSLRRDANKLSKLEKAIHDSSTGAEMVNSIRRNVEGIRNLERAIQESIEHLEEVTEKHEDETDRLEEYLAGGGIDRSKLGEPPLANRKDPFLDRERIDMKSDGEPERTEE